VAACKAGKAEKQRCNREAKPPKATVKNEERRMLFRQLSIAVDCNQMIRDTSNQLNTLAASAALSLLRAAKLQAARTLLLP